MSLLLLLSSSTPKTGWITPKDGNGWTVFNPSGDSRTIYCSSSSGSDANSGLAENLPKQTLAAAFALMRSGFPDHLYLKRGDSFSLTTSMNIDGRSLSEPAVFSAYGSGVRPTVDGGDVTIFNLVNPNAIAIIGWRLKSTRTVGSNPVGIQVQSWLPSSGLLIEDNYIEGFAGNITIDGNDTSNLSKFTIRRNVIINSWSTVGHSQGIFADDVDGLLIEENVLDHNGWNESIAEAEATIYNHNMYLSHFNRNVTIRNNISSRAANMGLKFQPRDSVHYISGNVFALNSFGAQIGGGVPQNYPPVTGAVYNVANNVITESLDNIGDGGAYGVMVANAIAGNLTQNIVCHKTATNTAWAISLHDGIGGWESRGVGIRDFVLQDNIVYDWRGESQVLQPAFGTPLPVVSNVDFIDNEFQEPNTGNSRKLLETYTSSSSVNSFIGGKYRHSAAGDAFEIAGATKTYTQWVTDTGETGSSETDVAYTDPSRKFTAWALSEGYANYEAFITACKSLKKDNGRVDRIAPSANDWIRAGFDLAALGGGGAWEPPYPPIISSPADAADFNVVSGTSGTIVTPVATGSGITWTRTGTDATDFSIDSSTGALSFAVTPDYDAPADANADNVYLVNLVATNADGSDSVSITVTVTPEGDSASSFDGITFGNITLRITGSIQVAPISHGATIFALAATANDFDCYGEGEVAYGEGVASYGSLVPV